MIKILILIFLLLIGLTYTTAQQTDSTLLKYEEADEIWEDEFIEHEGKVIRSIQYNIINVAGPSIDSRNGEDTSWFSKISNSLHLQTKDWVVKHWLLFKEGDIFESSLLTESERLLRLSGFFLDARIRILEADEDSVDLLIATKDRWTLTLNLSYSTTNESYFGIKDDNLLGMGQSVDASVTHSNDIRIGLGGRANYTLYNIAGTFINGGLDFRVNKKYNNQAIGLSRPFISTELDWAGGVEFRRESSELIYLQPGGLLYLPAKTLNYDVWIGRSFPFWFGDKAFRNKTRFLLSGRINKIEYTQKPDESFGLGDLFANSILYLAKGGIINRRYYKDYYIEGFGYTEDVPVGGILAITAGTEKRGNSSRFYSGLRGIFSRRIEDFGYTSLMIELGGFRKGSKIEQNVYDFNFVYHSPLLFEEDWKFRIFVQADYLLGFRLFEGEQIYLNKEKGIRGIEGVHLFGSKRGILNIETRIFSPYSILGFVLGANVFVDLGLITGNQVSLIQSKLYQGYGAGLRISNESIARAQFEIGIVYNPYTPESSPDKFSLILTGNFIIGIRNFEFLRPSVTGFKENN